MSLFRPNNLNIQVRDNSLPATSVYTKSLCQWAGDMLHQVATLSTAKNVCFHVIIFCQVLLFVDGGCAAHVLFTCLNYESIASDARLLGILECADWVQLICSESFLVSGEVLRCDARGLGCVILQYGSLGVSYLNPVEASGSPASMC